MSVLNNLKENKKDLNQGVNLKPQYCISLKSLRDFGGVRKVIGWNYQKGGGASKRHIFIEVLVERLKWEEMEVSAKEVGPGGVGRPYYLICAHSYFFHKVANHFFPL